jgi:hypothetical protein
LLLTAAGALALTGCDLPVYVGRDCTDAGCAGCQAERAGLDMYLLFDASSSQIFSWADTKRGLAQFLGDPASAGVGVGLQLFGESCDPASYETPTVPIADLPENAAAILGAFPLAPTLETPTRPALEGAIRHARSWQLAHPRRTTIVALVTDGFPEECESTTENVGQVARAGLAGTPPIRTFGIGIDSIGSIFGFVNDVTTASGVPGITVQRQSAEDLARAFATVRDEARTTPPPSAACDTGS